MKARFHTCGILFFKDDSLSTVF